MSRSRKPVTGVAFQGFSYCSVVTAYRVHRICTPRERPTVGMVGQPIQQRAGQGGIAEHLAPPSVFEVTGHDERPPILEELKNGTHVPQHLAQRATIILLAGEGQTNVDIARTTKWNRNTVKQWRKRWAASAPKLDKIEADQPRALRAAIGAALEDAPRSGNPGKITNIQLALILQMACEKPEKGLPLDRCRLGPHGHRTGDRREYFRPTSRALPRRGRSQTAFESLLVKS